MSTTGIFSGITSPSGTIKTCLVSEEESSPFNVVPS